jgi:hypothetical protein
VRWRRYSPRRWRVTACRASCLREGDQGRACKERPLLCAQSEEEQRARRWSG